MWNSHKLNKYIVCLWLQHSTLDLFWSGGESSWFRWFHGLSSKRNGNCLTQLKEHIEDCWKQRNLPVFPYYLAFHSKQVQFIVISDFFLIMLTVAHGIRNSNKITWGQTVWLLLGNYHINWIGYGKIWKIITEFV